MKTFVLSPTSINRSVKHLVRKLVPLYAGILLVLILFRIAESDMVPGKAYDLLTSLVSISGALVLGVISARRYRNSLRTFRLTVSDDSLTREMSNMPPVTLRQGEVKSIRKLPNGSLEIISRTQEGGIVVPPFIDEKDTLERMLNRFADVEVRQPGFFRRTLIGSLLLMLTSFLFLFNQENAQYRISALAGLSLSLFIGFIMIQRSQDFDRRTKRLSYVILIPVVTLIAAIVFQLY